MAMSLHSGQMWSAYKELYGLIDTALKNGNEYITGILETSLKTYLPEFLNILKNPAKSVVDHNKVLHANTQGILLANQSSPQTLTTDFITEAVTLSELFDLNEIAAVDLLFSAENQLSYFPDLPRGLVAVLLYYDGKACLVNCLKLLLQAREGRTWVVPDVGTNLRNVISKFMSQIVQQGMVSKVLDMIRVYNDGVQMDRLQLPEFRAVGPPKHKQQVSEKIKEINSNLCSCMFYLSCQSGLSRGDTLSLIGRLSTDSQEDYKSALSDQTIALLMTFLCAIDVKILEREDSEVWMEKLPILSDKLFVADVNREIISEVPWSIPGLKVVIQFAWAVTLNQLSMYIELDEYNDCMEELMNQSLENDVFFFIKNTVVANDSFYEEEYYIRRMHTLMTDFICNMPLKVKELRVAGDESARIIMSRQQDDLDIPPNLSKHFQHLLEFISDFYMKDPLGLELSSDFWISDDQNISSTFCTTQLPQKQVSLYKFIRLAGDMLLYPLYVPYINMLTGLSNNSTSALHCFNLLKMNSSGTHASIVSWDHFFTSLNQYYSSLRQESFHSQDHHQAPAFGAHRNGITPQEVEGLRAVLKLIMTVVEKSEEARVALSEGGRCHPVPIIFGLIGCPLVPKLKADLLNTLAAFAKTPEVTTNMWQMLENSQLLYSISSSNILLPGGIQSELEEIESRNEEYPMSRAFIRLIGKLVQGDIPPALGLGLRTPGFYPYLDFIKDAVFLKFNFRSYKRASEKWEVCAGVLKVMYRLIEKYEVNMEDFSGPQNYGKDPGHLLLLQLYSESNLLKMILFVIDEAIRNYERYVPIPDVEFLHESSLYALKIIQAGLNKQDLFLEALRQSGSPIIAIGLDKLLLGVNPRSGRSDHVVNIAKFVIHNGSLLKHAVSAMDIFLMITSSAYVQSKIIGLLIGSEEFIRELMVGFSECLECEEVEENNFDSNKEETASQMRVILREKVASLLLSSINHPTPNLAHLLSGFDVRKSIQKTSLQDPGIDGFPRTCLHSIVMMLNKEMDCSTGLWCIKNAKNFAQLAYQFIHALCTNVQTYIPVLRYLRSHDFLYKQVAQLPFPVVSKDESSSPLLHGSWLLKSMIVELRVSSMNKQRSYVQRIMDLLLDGKMHKGGKSQSRLLEILDSINFVLRPPSSLEMDVFNKSLIEQVITSCETKERGYVQCEIKNLFNILVLECSGLTGPLASQRERALQEINKICAKVAERNVYRKEMYSRKQAFIGWRQAVEIILTACPHDLLSGEKRQLFIVDILQSLMHKLTPDASADLSSQGACVILLLVSNLSSTFKNSEMERALPHPSCDFVSPDISMVVAKQEGSSSRSTFSTSLQVVLSGLIQYLLTTASLGQKVRIYIYGALLYYFEIAEKPVALDIFVNGPIDRSLEKQLSKKDTEYDKLSRENMSTVNKFAGPLLACLCKDACDGHDIAKMLVMSVLSKILSRDVQKLWIPEMTSKGYIQHMINGLLDDDNQLRDLTPRPEPLRALFIFQSKIGLLTRISMTQHGAQTLLDLDLMSHLSKCSVLDLRPEQDHASPEGFIPTVLTRYRQHILFPVLRLCLSFLTSLGSGNIMAANKVLSFIMSHIDVFLNILSDKQPQHHTLESLRELQLVAAVVAWTAQDAYLEEMMLLDAMYGELKMCMNRLQRQMMQLLLKFSLSDARRKQFVNQVLENTKSYVSKEEVGDDNDIKSKVLIVMEEIISSALTLATSLITKSASNKAVPVLYGPNLSGGMEHYRNSPFSRVHEMPSASSRMPCLGVIVQLLDDSSLHFLSTLEMHKTLLGKYNNLSDLAQTEIRELCGKDELNDKMSLQQRNEFVAGKLINLLKYRSKEIRLLSYIIENALLLLWRHLDFYLVVCQSGGSHKCSGGVGSDSFDRKPLDLELSKDQLNQLKQECLTWIDDALLRRLQDIEHSYGQSKSKYGFMTVLVRKIKRMLTLNTMQK